MGKNAKKAYDGIHGCQLEQLLLAEAVLIGRKKTERVVVVAADGTVLADRSGSETQVSVSIPKRLRPRLPGAVATHNHPFCSALSVPFTYQKKGVVGESVVSDFAMFAYLGLREMRMVCCCSGEPLVSRVRRVSGRPFSQRASRGLMVLVMYFAGKAAGRVGQDDDAAWQEIFHRALKAAARKRPELIRYERVRLDLAVAEILGVKLKDFTG
jgi:hypothetical protein